MVETSNGEHIVIMKFGGTSVATREGRAAAIERIGAERGEGTSPVVVVSAMGRAGSPYATDTLLSLLDGLDTEPHEKDLLMSCGETVSAIVMASSLRSAGVPARALTGSQAGIITSDVPGEARIGKVDVTALMSLIDDGIVPVVAGFQGIDEDGEVTTLGRGGSDTTACALGVALRAQSVDIYKDVDGIMTADPSDCDGAIVLERICADELFEMATFGAKIVHAPAAELALKSGIPMKVRNTFSAAPGTAVVDIAAYRPTAVATAVTRIDDIVRVRIKLPYAKNDAAEHMHLQTRVFGLLADAGISIDMFTPLNDRLVFSIDASAKDRAAALLEEAGFDYALREDLSKVTVVGAGMHGVAGVMSRVATCLDEAGVDILQIADSHTTISVLVASAAASSALAALHGEFAL